MVKILDKIPQRTLWSEFSDDPYVQLLTESFIFYEASRYDIRGKARLKTGAKYYVVDTGLRNTALGQISNFGSQLENIIYIELKRRGYEVFVGKLYSEEIDFVCFKDKIKEYFQVAYQLPVDSDREQRNLLHITDNYKKTIITMNRMDVGMIEGIPVVHAVDWLLVDSQTSYWNGGSNNSSIIQILQMS